jgi:hypothetical protein
MELKRGQAHLRDLIQMEYVHQMMCLSSHETLPSFAAAVRFLCLTSNCLRGSVEIGRHDLFRAPGKRSAASVRLNERNPT